MENNWCNSESRLTLPRVSLRKQVNCVVPLRAQLHTCRHFDIFRFCGLRAFCPFFPVADFLRMTLSCWLLNPSLLNTLPICKTFKSNGNGRKHASSRPRPCFETERIAENFDTFCRGICHTRKQLSLHGKSGLILFSRSNVYIVI